jgi:hypothetical protein
MMQRAHPFIERLISLGDPTVPASFTRQLLRNQEFAMVRMGGLRAQEARAC